MDNFDRASQFLKKAIDEGSIPRYLYKFKSINSHFDELITKKELWFSKPVEFNDPFDCQISADSDCTYHEIVQYLEETTSTRKTSYEIETMAKICFENPAYFNKIINEGIRTKINSSGVCCFSKNKDNILMWSHYASCHSGLCLKFDLLKDEKFFIFPLVVSYKENYPIYNHIKDKDRLIEVIVNTKAKNWEYEDEVRIMKFNYGKYAFNSESLVGITFGAKCPETEVERVIKLTEENNFNNVIFDRARLKEKSYGLEFVNIKTRGNIK